MPTIERFEDVQAWQSARELNKAILELVKAIDDPILIDQFKRAANSAMATIAEGFGRKTDKEFVNYLSMAHGSVSEIMSHLYAALDGGHITQPQFDAVYALAIRTSKQIQGFSLYLRKAR